MSGNMSAVALAASIFAAACAGTTPTAPTAPALSVVGTTGTQTSGDPESTLSPTGEQTTSAISGGMTDITLANAGWTCIQPGGGLVLCAPPGTGLPPIPPTADGAATYNVMAFTLDHEFLHHVKLLRPDLYHGQPCLGGDPWHYLAIVGYYECIIPGRGSL